MAAKLGTVIALGSEIVATKCPLSTNNRLLCTLNSTTRRRSIRRTRSSFIFGKPNLGVASFLPLRASPGPNPTEPNSPTQNPISSILQDDWNYLWKLLIGSVLGAALIKYGSIVIPDITRPNIVLALLMIFAPVVVAVLLLLKGSQKE